MNWINELDKYGYNILIDELVWHIEKGRNPLSVKLVRSSKQSGYEFLFSKAEPSFLNVNPEAIEENWFEAKEIVDKFTQLEGMSFVGT